MDIQQIVRESIENYGHVWREEMNWVWIQTDVTASGDTNETDVFEIAPIKGIPYERLVCDTFASPVFSAPDLFGEKPGMARYQASAIFGISS